MENSTEIIEENIETKKIAKAAPFEIDKMALFIGDRHKGS